VHTRHAAQDLQTIHCAILAFCVVVALVRRASGWDPLSLWLDDEWMATIIRHASLSQIAQLNIPAPLGFTVLEKLVATSSADLEWPLQVVPFVAGLLSILLFWMLARRVLESRFALGLSTLYVACHPVHRALFRSSKALHARQRRFTNTAAHSFLESRIRR
jgi:hypothetical protein